jgi:thymidine phosphorylase
MAQIVDAQGPSPLAARLGEHTHEVRADRAGFVSAIDCLRIASIARLAGAPTDPGAGLDILRKVGEPVAAGEPLYRIYGSEPSDFGFAVEAAAEDPGVSITP